MVDQLRLLSFCSCTVEVGGSEEEEEEDGIIGPLPISLQERVCVYY